MNNFLRAYIEAALWSSSDDQGDNFGNCFLAPETFSSFEKDCEDFQTANAADLAIAYKTEKYSPSQAGFDFWLTRNRHGAGFWDRRLGEVGDRLTEAAHSYREKYLYLNDEDQLVYSD